MNNDDLLSNLASALGLNNGTSSDNSTLTNPLLELNQTENFSLDSNTSIIQPIHPAENSSLLEVVQAASIGNTDVLKTHQHYDPHHVQGLVIGNPDEAMKSFHQQNNPDTCDIAIEKSIIESITGVNISENQLIQTAENHHWYQQGAGTPINNVGDLITLETGIPVEKHFGGSLAEIAEKIANGEQVMVSVNSEIVNVPDSNSIFGSLSPPMLENAIDKNHVANHVQEVIGIEIKNGDSQHPFVIVNDPSSPNGKALEIPAEQFNAAWKTGGNFIASTVTNPESLLSNLGTNHVDNQHLTNYNVAGGTYDPSFNQDQRNYELREAEEQRERQRQEAIRQEDLRRAEEQRQQRELDERQRRQEEYQREQLRQEEARRESLRHQH